MTSSDQQSHSINLVDTTRVANDTPEPSGSTPEPTRTNTAGTAGESIKNRVSRGGTLRDEWTKRKYARYQEARYNDDHLSSNDERQDDGQIKRQDSARPGRLRDRIPFRSKKAKAASNQQEYAVDILYENQRGAFLCGIPLYSSNSLLNFDPSPWQTADFSDSPVDITNAQVPDPTWAWEWKRWYVDMSHDVDEEGWEYSFSFNRNFAWHGTHPLLYSFVRRRRWIRKRVKVAHASSKRKSGAMSEAHDLNAEYFTIHAATREGSRDRESSNGPPNAARSSWMGSVAEKDETTDDDDADIDNISTLLRRLKQTTIDRKKLDALRNFLAKGGDELLSLPDSITEIMGLFMYQSSRRLAYLELQNAVAALSTPPSKAPARSPSPSRSRSPASNNKPAQLRALRSTLDAVPSSARHAEFWSDAKAGEDLLEGLDYETGSTAVLPALPMGSRVKGQGGRDDIEANISPIREGLGAGARIKGIPRAAGLDDEVGLVGRLGSGKGSARERGRRGGGYDGVDDLREGDVEDGEKERGDEQDGGREGEETGQPGKRGEDGDAEQDDEFKDARESSAERIAKDKGVDSKEEDVD